MRGARETPPICAQARFGHCIAKCDQTLYMYGGRTMGGAIESFMQFDARPLVWRPIHRLAFQLIQTETLALEGAVGTASAMTIGGRAA